MVTILTIAGSDPSGGAGIQADLRTFGAIGARGISAVTAVTAQNEKEFLSIYPMPADVLTQQLSAAAKGGKIEAIKIGMIATAANVQAIIWFLKQHRDVPVVIDPVFNSSTGYPLIESSALPIFKQHLLPLATVVTPNIDEARTLAKMHVGSVETMETAARMIYEDIRRLRGGGMKPLCVIVKGGHLKDIAVDILFDGKDIVKIDGCRLKKELHGTGCIYSAALAAHIALGSDFTTAARKAKKYIEGEILSVMQ